MLPRQPQRSCDAAIDLRNDRCQRSIGAGHSARHRDDVVVEEMLAEHLRGDAQIRAGSEGCAHSPAESIRDTHVVRITAERKTAEAAELDAATHFFADDGVREVIELPRTGAGILIAGWQLHRAAE